MRRRFELTEATNTVPLGSRRDDSNRHLVTYRDPSPRYYTFSCAFNTLRLVASIKPQSVEHPQEDFSYPLSSGARLSRSSSRGVAENKRTADGP